MEVILELAAFALDCINANYQDHHRSVGFLSFLSIILLT